MMRQKFALAFAAGLLLSACGDAGITDPQVAPDGPRLVEDTYTCEGGEACAMPPLIAVVDPNEVDCSDPYQAVLYTDVCGTGSATGDPWSPEDPRDPSDPTDPGDGGTTTPTQPPPDTVPCATGDEVVDDPTVQGGVDELWRDSNYGPNVNLADRTEQGGWLVQTANGYQVVRWTQLQTSWCGAEGEEPFPTSGTVVGFVHTHPYALGETVVSCEWTIETYMGDPSSVDRALSMQLGQALGRSEGLPGYIVDANGITRFVGEDDSEDRRHARCGY